MILNHITAHPGVSFGVLKKVFNLADGTLRYHLNYLEGHQEIRTHFDGKNKCYYPVEKYIFDRGANGNVNISRLTTIQERLLDTIRRYPGITQKELIYRANLKRLTISNNMKKLVDFGVVRKEPNGRNICYYYISDLELQKKIKRRLIEKFLNYEIDERTFLALKGKLEKREANDLS
jgi:predicted transcriptional regulator